jgi:hypothetical protein
MIDTVYAIVRLSAFRAVSQQATFGPSSGRVNMRRLHGKRPAGYSFPKLLADQALFQLARFCHCVCPAQSHHFQPVTIARESLNCAAFLCFFGHFARQWISLRAPIYTWKRTNEPIHKFGSAAMTLWCDTGNHLNAYNLLIPILFFGFSAGAAQPGPVVGTVEPRVGSFKLQ